MTRFPAGGGSAAFLVLVAACALAWTGYRLVPAQEAAAVPTAEGPPPAVPALPPAPLRAPRPKAELAGIVERPPFERTRRPPVAEPPARPDPAPIQPLALPPALPPTPPPMPPQAALLGTVVTGGLTLALLRDGTGRTLRVTVGETVEGWRLAEASGRTALFVRDGFEHRLELKAHVGGEPFQGHVPAFPPHPDPFAMPPAPVPPMAAWPSGPPP